VQEQRDRRRRVPGLPPREGPLVVVDGVRHGGDGREMPWSSSSADDASFNADDAAAS
jgi:hypothetical protein